MHGRDAAFAAIDDACDDERLAATAKALIAGYDARWHESHKAISLDAVEDFFESDLVNLKTMAASRTFRMAGLLDKLARDEWGLVLYDHKTTSMDISDPDAVYWRQLAIEGQPSHYELLLLANGIKVDRIVWDVIRKPTIRPKKIPKKEQAEIASLGTYHGQTVRNRVVEVEDGELFQARLTADTLANPDKYYQRRSVSRDRAELAEYAGELWDIGQEILSARREDRWYRNSGACMNYGTPCEYLGICSGHDTPDSSKWVRVNSVHRELPTDGDDRNLLTNTRVRCFQTCRRKHFYRYEMGLERADAEEKEALYFGSLIHTALDAWWVATSGDGDGAGQRPRVDEVREHDGPRLFS